MMAAVTVPKSWLFGLLLVLIAGVAISCGAQGSGGATAQTIASPTSGYTCFAILNSGGDAVGGNCVKD